MTGDAVPFAALGGRAYLDTATQGVGPAEATAAVRRAVEAWQGGRADHRVWEVEAERCREAAASLWGCTPGDVALLPSIVALAAPVAAHHRDARVVVPACEYRSNLLPWLVGRDPADVRLVGSVSPEASGGSLTAAMVEAIDERTGVVAVSSVQSADGVRVDLSRIVEAAHAYGAAVFVDATQSLGAIADDAVAAGADFVAAAGYKWLLGIRGAAYGYVSPSWHERLTPMLAGPHAADDYPAGQVYGPHWRPHPDARRFDQSPAWLCWVGSRPGLELLAAGDAGARERHALGLAARLRAGCERLGLAGSLSPVEVPAQIVALSVSDPGTLAADLDAAEVAVAVRGGRVRLGFHVYNSDEHVDRVLAVLERHADGRVPVPAGDTSG